MTREEFEKQLDGMAFNGENLGKFLRENYTLSEPIRNCKECKYSKDGHCAGTEKCHECMWESRFEALSAPKGRLIDADALLNETVKKNSVWNSISNTSGETLEQIVNRLQSKPTTITENMTNGDVFKALFPKLKINKKWIATRNFELQSDSGNIEIVGMSTREWWDAPYKGNFIMPTPTDNMTNKDIVRYDPYTDSFIKGEDAPTTMDTKTISTDNGAKWRYNTTNNTLAEIRAEIIEMRSKQNCSCSDCLDIIDKYSGKE